jgi:hypothetical protein
MDPVSGITLVGTSGNEVMVVGAGSGLGAAKAFKSSQPQQPQHHHHHQQNSNLRPVKEVWLIDPLKVKQHLQKWGKLGMVALDVKGDIRRERGSSEWRRGGKLSFVQIANAKNEVLMVDCMGPFETARMFQESGLKQILEDASVLKGALAAGGWVGAGGSRARAGSDARQRARERRAVHAGGRPCAKRV